MTRKGVQESGNAWMPAVCAMSDHFVVSGSWGHSETPQFAVFAQRISLDGKLIGEAMDGALQPQFQVFSSVGCRDDEGIEPLGELNDCDRRNCHSYPCQGVNCRAIVADFDG